MSRCHTDYEPKAESDAKETVSNYSDDILEQLLKRGEASDDLCGGDYPNGDAWHQENHTDKSYDLQEACEVLTQLSEHEETDSGLWEGLGMKEALSACAAYTYANAVYEEWRELIRRINEAAEAIVEQYDEETSELETAIEALNDEACDHDCEAADEDNEAPDYSAGECHVAASRCREDADQKQIDLDALPETKRAALKAMIEETIR